MDLRRLDLEGVIELRPPKFQDDRGFFSETYNSGVLKRAGVETKFVQDNHSLSGSRGTLRGLHYQLAPFPQEKLVRVVRGAIFDVAVDIRRSSPTFGKWVGCLISAKDWNQLLIPVGYAHGFVTLEDNTEVIYKVSDFFSREHDRSIRFDDPQISIEWPIEEITNISEKDRSAPLLKDADVFA
mgnify:CR=1 FL=1